MKIRDLRPGDAIGEAIFIAATPHPIWPSLELVVWKRFDGQIILDALRPDQELGHLITPLDENTRLERLYRILVKT
jgi:hypothetical protein